MWMKTSLPHNNSELDLLIALEIYQMVIDVDGLARMSMPTRLSKAKTLASKRSWNFASSKQKHLRVGSPEGGLFAILEIEHDVAISLDHENGVRPAAMPAIPLGGSEPQVRAILCIPSNSRET